MLQFNKDSSKRWNIHDYGLATYFFGIDIIQSMDAITNQRPFSRSVITEMFGVSWESQETGASKHAIPLPAGTAYEARLAGEIPASPAKLKDLEIKFGYKFRTLLGKFMQLTSWTRVDLVTATIRLSQYQSSPGTIHFEALHNMLLYLCCQPDLGLTYTRHSAVRPLETHPLGAHPPVPSDLPTPTVSSVTSSPSMQQLIIDWDVSHTDGLGDPIAMTHKPTHADDSCAYENVPTMQVPCVASVHMHHKSTPPRTCTSTPPITVLSPPPTEGEMDANHGSSVFETVGFSGVVLLSLGTVFFFLSLKQATTAYNTAESELNAATAAGKVVKWVRIWMADMGIPFTDPIPMGKDNEATRIIGHAGKLTCNVRQTAIQTTNL
jgi:hypothetical protein